MKYQSGDVVYVRPDLRTGYWYQMEDADAPAEIATGEMLAFAGLPMTIDRVRSYGYTLEGIDDFNWTDEMFDEERMKTDWSDEWDGSTTADEIIGLISGHL